MRRLYMWLATAWVAVFALGCGSNGSGQVAAQVAEKAAQAVEVSTGPGYFFTLLFIVIPVIIILVKLFRESEATSDSLISLEGQLRRLNNKIDDLEASIKGEKKSD